MAKRGQTITNKVTGETITWLATSEDTHGEFLEIGLLGLPKCMAATNHVHPNQDEFFEIKRGQLKIQIGKNMHLLNAGQSIMVPKGVSHQWWNPSETEIVYMHLTFTPARVTELFFEQFFGLCNDSKNNADGSFKFWQAMAAINYYDIYNSTPPVSVQKIFGYVLGPLARLAGYKKLNLKYSKIGTQ